MFHCIILSQYPPATTWYTLFVSSAATLLSAYVRNQHHDISKIYHAPHKTISRNPRKRGEGGELTIPADFHISRIIRARHLHNTRPGHAAERRHTFRNCGRGYLFSVVDLGAASATIDDSSAVNGPGFARDEITELRSGGSAVRRGGPVSGPMPELVFGAGLDGLDLSLRELMIKSMSARVVSQTRLHSLLSHTRKWTLPDSHHRYWLLMLLLTRRIEPASQVGRGSACRGLMDVEFIVQLP